MQLVSTLSLRFVHVHCRAAHTVHFTRSLARFFVGEARKCSHRWNGGVVGVCELSYSINPYATQTSDDGWEQCYLQ